MIYSIDDQLKNAVKEYYDWHHNRNGRPIKFVVNNIHGQYHMLLVRFIDENGIKMSGLMDFQHWKDGHWDVTETYAFPRECEKQIVNRFENRDLNLIDLECL